MNELKIGNLVAKLPIVQAGMGVAISLSNLASAVANQGGIGVISAVCIGMKEKGHEKNLKKANITGLRNEIRKARSQTNGILGVNIMLAVTDFNELLNTSIEEKIDIVFVGAGLPLKMPVDKLRENNVKFVPKVSSSRAIKIILQYWDKHYNYLPDAFAVEGPKAGGHLGYKRIDLESEEIPLKELIRDAVDIVKPFEDKYKQDIPIIAAGGIYSGKDIYEIMELGAKGVKMGTRFVPTHECDASEEFKQTYIDSKEDDITIIDSPVGLPGRAIKNCFISDIENGEKKPIKCYWKCLKTCDYKQVPYCIAEALFNAARGNLEKGFAFAGSNAFKSEKIMYVKDLITDIITEFNVHADIIETQKT